MYTLMNFHIVNHLGNQYADQESEHYHYFRSL